MWNLALSIQYCSDVDNLLQRLDSYNDCSEECEDLLLLHSLSEMSNTLAVTGKLYFYLLANLQNNVLRSLKPSSK